MRNKVFVGIGIFIVVAMVFLITSIVMFACDMDAVCHRFNIIAQGKLDRYTDCIGDPVIRIGQYEVDKNIRIYAKGHMEGGLRPKLKGGDCEYVLYKGWWFGLGDIYYIEAK